ncbi:MAG: hypothetical protein QG620_656 [Patescibacteria group bacterium]|nr:hypothetical protein [Patescibacteria group bacterium]
MVTFGVVVVVFFCYFFAWALCSMLKQGDQASDRALEEMQKRREELASHVA